MLIFRARRATVICIPSLALMLAVPWIMIEAASLAGARHSPQVTAGFALAVCAVLAFGTRIVRRVGDEIVSTGLRGSRHVPARQAVLGIRMQARTRYAQLALDVMAHPDFSKPDPEPVTIDSFSPNGTEAVMRAARRAASLLGLPEPILAPGLSDGSSRPTDQPDGADVEGFDLRRRWAETSGWTKLLVLAGLVSGGWMVLSSFLHPGVKLYLTCAQPWHVRDPSPTFNFTCEGSPFVEVQAGPAALEVWDPDRGCWIERRFVVPKNGARVDVAGVVKSGRCANRGWPPPEATGQLRRH